MTLKVKWQLVLVANGAICWYDLPDCYCRLSNFLQFVKLCRISARINRGFWKKKKRRKTRERKCVCLKLGEGRINVSASISGYLCLGDNPQRSSVNPHILIFTFLVKKNKLIKTDRECQFMLQSEQIVRLQEKTCKHHWCNLMLYSCTFASTSDLHELSSASGFWH